MFKITLITLYITISILLTIIILFFILGHTHGSKRGYTVLLSSIATPSSSFTDVEIADAIFEAEGGSNATYLYGIRSVHYSDIKEARKICLNTIRNNRIRFKNQNRYTDYLCFLASRYCPIGADNDTGTNKYWLKNVKYFLEAQRANKN